MGVEIFTPPPFQRPSGMLVLANAQLNLVNNVNTLVELDSIPGDFTDGIEDIVNHRITPGVAGEYSIVGNVKFSSVVANTRYSVNLYLNLANMVTSWVVLHSSNTDPLSFRTILPCQNFSATDYIELWAQSNSGNNLVDIDINYTFLAVQRVR